MAIEPNCMRMPFLKCRDCPFASDGTSAQFTQGLRAWGVKDSDLAAIPGALLDPNRRGNARRLLNAFKRLSESVIIWRHPRAARSPWSFVNNNCPNGTNP